MPRHLRICPAKICFHVLNRAVARLPLFEKEADYDAFERVLRETFEREALPIYSFCLMPNHWHFVVRPKSNNQLSDFFRWLTHTHTMECLGTQHMVGTVGNPGKKPLIARPSPAQGEVRLTEVAFAASGNYEGSATSLLTSLNLFRVRSGVARTEPYSKFCKH